MYFLHLFIYLSKQFKFEKNFQCHPNFHLQECIALERLYLAHNGITKMEGLSTLANLQYLDVSSNKLAAIEDIEKLTWYEYMEKLTSKFSIKKLFHIYI